VQRGDTVGRGQVLHRDAELGKARSGAAGLGLTTA
jgi:hypothetical protein